MTEEQIQRQIAEYLDWVLPSDSYWTAINPIPGKTKAAAGRSKAMGMKAGVPDILIVYQGKAFFIEVKKEGGYLSKAQKETHENIRSSGAAVYTARSVEDVAEILEEMKNGS